MKTGIKKVSRVESRKSKDFRLGETSGSRPSALDPRPFGFTLIEVMVVVALLGLIVVALMGVFNSTQKAFRASVTQSDVLEGGRAVMDLMAGDLREMSPSLGASNGAVNFYANTNAGYLPLVQPLIASSSARTNVLENFFILSRENQNYTAVGYVVIANSADGNLYSLYRFSMTTNVSSFNAAAQLYTNFLGTSYTNSPPWSHLIDGVVGLRVRAFDTNGSWMARGYTNAENVFFQPPVLGENGFYMFGKTLPASVEIEMATLEDRVLQRAESLPNNLPLPSPGDRRTIFLQDQAGKVHIFRQRVSVPNVDPSAYQ